MIVSRKQERAKLDRLFTRKEPAFLAVYGRRRIGKTFLVSRYFAEKNCFYLEVTGVADATKAEQLRNFARRVNPAEPPQFENWDAALHLLWQRIATLPKQTKVVLFFDELPWLARQKSGFLTALDYFWNHHLSRRNNTLLIVCGSAAAWMIRKIIDNKGGLHNRVTDRMPMQPFTIAETEAYLQYRDIRWDRAHILEFYMALGGVALYLSQIEPGESASQAIDRLCFAPGGFLAGEFERLFGSLFGDSGHHMAIVKTLAKKSEGLTLEEVLKEAKLSSGGTTTRTLEELVLSGFVEPTRETWKRKKGTRFRLIDEFSLFHLTWMQQATPSLGRGTWLRLQESGRFNAWSGYSFENFCFRHKAQLIKALELGVVVESISTWSIGPDLETEEAGAQIDLVIERRDRCTNLCEAKYRQREYAITKAMAANLQNKKARFRSVAKTRTQLFTTLITPHGAKRNEAFLGTVDQVVTLKDFFE